MDEKTYKFVIVPSPYMKSLGTTDRYILFDPVERQYASRWNPTMAGPDWSLEELIEMGYKLDERS